MWIVDGILFEALESCLLVINVILKYWFNNILSGGMSLCNFGILFVFGF